MAKKQSDQISSEEQARLDEEILNAEIAKEEAEKQNPDGSQQKEEYSEKKNYSSEEQVDLDETGEYKIVILKNTPHLKEGKEHIVSGNIANILIKRGIATLVEAMPEKSKINP